AIIGCVSTNETNQGRENHAAIMARFEETLSRRIGQKLTMPALCAEVNVPERTLRMCCSEFLAVSPTRYLLLQRLNNARAALRRADPTTVGVAEIAQKHQFRNPGLFAVTSRPPSGKSPSPTLHQNPKSDGRSD